MDTVSILSPLVTVCNTVVAVSEGRQCRKTETRAATSKILFFLGIFLLGRGKGSHLVRYMPLCTPGEKYVKSSSPDVFFNNQRRIPSMQLSWDSFRSNICYTVNIYDMQQRKVVSAKYK